MIILNLKNEQGSCFYWLNILFLLMVDLNSKRVEINTICKNKCDLKVSINISRYSGK